MYQASNLFTIFWLPYHLRSSHLIHFSVTHFLSFFVVKLLSEYSLKLINFGVRPNLKHHRKEYGVQVNIEIGDDASRYLPPVSNFRSNLISIDYISTVSSWERIFMTQDSLSSEDTDRNKNLKNQNSESETNLIKLYVLKRICLSEGRARSASDIYDISSCFPPSQWNSRIQF